VTRIHCEGVQTKECGRKDKSETLKRAYYSVRARPCSNKKRPNQRERALMHCQCIAISRGNPNNNNELKKVNYFNCPR
jgi:hypothetical protein